MDFTTFQTYPIEILSIDESYNNEILAIENFTIGDINYSGNADEVESLLPFFVFFNFCDYRDSQVVAKTGETKSVQEFTVPSYTAQVRAWNIGVEKLKAICDANAYTANKKYLSKIGLL